MSLFLLLSFKKTYKNFRLHFNNMKEELSVMVYLSGIIYFCYMKIRNLFLYANKAYGTHISPHIPHLNPAAVLGRCWWDCLGVYLHESKTRVQNLFFFLIELPPHLFSNLSLSLKCLFAETFQASLQFCVYLNPWRIPSTLVCWTCSKPTENIPNRGEPYNNRLYSM